MILKKKISIARRLLLSIISSFLGLIWVGLIFLPQQKDTNLVLGAVLYYIPFFILFLFLLTYILSKILFEFLQKKNLKIKFMLCTIAALITLLILSNCIYFDEITIVSFFTNLFSFLFSLISYYMLESFLFGSEV